MWGGSYGYESKVSGTNNVKLKWFPYKAYKAYHVTMNNIKLNIGDYLQYNIPIMPIKRYYIIVM